MAADLIFKRKIVRVGHKSIFNPASSRVSLAATGQDYSDSRKRVIDTD